MKKIFIALFAISLFISCSTDNSSVQNLELIEKVSLSDTEIENIDLFTSNVFKDLKSFSLESDYQNSLRVNYFQENISDNLKKYIFDLENTGIYETENKYLESVFKLKNRALNDSNLTYDEKKSVLITVYALEKIINEYSDASYSENTIYNSSTYAVYSKKGWWNSWGRCASGVLGGAILGGLGGAAITSPTVVGVPVGVVVGVIGGGLSGAAAAC